jgi:hypothetical protein
MLKQKNSNLHNLPAKAGRNKGNNNMNKIIVFHVLHRGFSPVICNILLIFGFSR